jgi:RNA polymerase primary sigma factor
MKKISLNNLGGENITNANNRDIFNKYLVEVSKFKPLTREEEFELFKRVNEDGDKNALDKVCKHNLRFVISVAKKYAVVLTKSSLTLEDLVNEGNLGLCVAATRFDYKSGNKFISYAVFWIKQHILTSIQKNVKSIRIPLHVKNDINKILEKQQELEQIQGQSVSTLEVFESLMETGQLNDKYDIGRVNNMLNINNFEDSLNRFVGTEDKTELSELIKSDYAEPDSELIEKERRAFALKMIETLPLMIRHYFIDYYGLFGHDELNIHEMAEKYGENAPTIKARMNKYLMFLARKNKNSKIYFLGGKKENKDIIYCI